MRYFFFILILNFGRISLNGQDSGCNCNRGELGDSRLTEKLTYIVLPAGEVKIPEDEVFARWRYGKIFLNNGEAVSGEFIRYDGLNDQLIVDSKNAAIRLAIDKYTIQGFDMDLLNSEQSLQFRRIKVTEKTGTSDVFLQVLVTGKNNLYARRQLLRTLELNKISRNYRYYIRKEDGSMVSFAKPSRSSLLKMFPEKSDLYRNSLRRQHVHIRNETQLINTLEFLNTL